MKKPFKKESENECSHECSEEPFCIHGCRCKWGGQTLSMEIRAISGKAGWSWGCVSAIDSNGRAIWIADAHRDDGKRFVGRADEKLTAFK